MMWSSHIHRQTTPPLAISGFLAVMQRNRGQWVHNTHKSKASWEKFSYKFALNLFNFWKYLEMATMNVLNHLNALKKGCDEGC